MNCLSPYSVSAERNSESDSVTNEDSSDTTIGVMTNSTSSNHLQPQSQQQANNHQHHNNTTTVHHDGPTSGGGLLNNHQGVQQTISQSNQLAQPQQHQQQQSSISVASLNPATSNLIKNATGTEQIYSAPICQRVFRFQSFLALFACSQTDRKHPSTKTNSHNWSPLITRTLAAR